MFAALAQMFAKGGYSNSSRADSGATGGFINSAPDHSNWSVQIQGSGFNVASPAGLLALAGVAGALWWLSKR